jgi:hydroxymethylglutaryl-CoA synthase
MVFLILFLACFFTSQQLCYYQALEDVYSRFCERLSSSDPDKSFDATSHDYFVFHAPYNKLVSKSYGRLFFLDARRKKEAEGQVLAGIEPEWLSKPLEETYTDKSLEKKLKAMSKASFEQRLADANMASKLVGNTYTASVFFGLASLVDRAGGRGDLGPGKSIVVFSYGSGAIATIYRLSV